MKWAHFGRQINPKRLLPMLTVTLDDLYRQQVKYYYYYYPTELRPAEHCNAGAPPAKASTLPDWAGQQYWRHMCRCSSSICILARPKLGPPHEYWLSSKRARTGARRPASRHIKRHTGGGPSESPGKPIVIS